MYKGSTVYGHRDGQTQVTATFTTAAKGMAGWDYTGGLDLSAAGYIVIELGEKPATGTSLIITDAKGGTYSRTLSSATTKLRLSNTDSKTDRSQIARIAFQTAGTKAVTIKRIFLSDDGTTPTGIDGIRESIKEADAPIFNLHGMRVKTLSRHGIYIKGGRKVVF